MPIFDVHIYIIIINIMLYFERACATNRLSFDVDLFVFTSKIGVPKPSFHYKIHSFTCSDTGYDELLRNAGRYFDWLKKDFFEL